MYPETRVLLCQRIEVLLEENVVLVHVSEDEVNLGDIPRRATADDSTNNLQHGGDAGAAGNHAKVADQVGPVYKSALGAPNADGLADGKGGHVLGNVAGGVRLDEQVEVAGLVIARDRGVRADDFLGGAVWLGERGADGDVLAYGEAEGGGRGREKKAVAGDGTLVGRR